MTPEEFAILQPWLAAFQEVYGAPVQFRALDAGEGLSSWSFPPVFADPRLIGGTGHFRHRPAMVAHVRRLGFGWEEYPDARILTCPTPHTFNHLLERFGLPDCGYRLVYVHDDAMQMSIGPWLARYLDGLIPVHVAPPRLYRPSPQMREPMRGHLNAMVHDLSVHALNYHLVPRAEIVSMTEAIRAALPDRFSEWSKAGAAGPLTLATFLDNDFNRYCYGVWCAAETPGDFPRIFSLERNRRQLLDALAVRIDETRVGLGDVLSGKTSDMPALAKVEFRVG